MCSVPSGSAPIRRFISKLWTFFLTIIKAMGRPFPLHNLSEQERRHGRKKTEQTHSGHVVIYLITYFVVFFSGSVSMLGFRFSGGDCYRCV